MTATVLDPQVCSCGNDTYRLHLIEDGDGLGFVAACGACGRITGSIDKGLNYRGKSVNEIT